MLILGVDVETTGLDPKTDRIIELGMVVWDTDRNQPVEIWNALLGEKDYPKISPEITEITGISQQDWNTFSKPLHEGLNAFIDYATICVAVVAHNALEFDKVVIEEELLRKGMITGDYLWVDTMIDIPYPATMGTRKLTYLAAEHGVLNPFPHRAFADVLTMFTVLKNYNINEVINRSKQPVVIMEAELLPPWKDNAPEGEKQTDLARARGYRWNGAIKKWQKRLKENEAKAEQDAAPFPVKLLRGT